MRGIVLSGFLGTGKTTVAPLVAARLGLPWVDTDAELARRAGVPVPQLWRERGEVGFRELEGDLVRELFADGVTRVLSFGGGTVTAKGLRHLALDRSFLVTLACAPSRLLSQRLGDLSLRPTLAARDPRARIEALMEERDAIYAECHLRIATDARSPEEVADRIVLESGGSQVAVALGKRTYSVKVVADAPSSLSDALTRLAPSSLLVVSDTNVIAAQGAALDAALAPLGLPTLRVVLPPGEENKTRESVARIWDAAVGKVDRDAVVLGFGGGVVGDLAGFAASTLLRGLRVVQAPTTLLSMVDASVGGKTGFDAPEGKNLIGAFHQPSAVVVDVHHLRTLPERDFLCGLAEVVKAALACDAALFARLEADAERLAKGDVATLVPVILRAIGIKSQIVRDDELETGARKLLNLGHTLGHALEAAGGYASLRHGEAVAIGLVAECRVAEALGACAPGLADRVEALLLRMRLPTRVPPAELARAWPHIVSDKKRSLEKISMPLPARLGDATVRAVPLDVLARAAGIGDV